MITTPERSKKTRKRVAGAAAVIIVLGLFYLIFAPSPGDIEALNELLEEAEELASDGDAQGLADLTWPPGERAGFLADLQSEMQRFNSPLMRLERTSGAPAFSVMGDAASARLAYRVTVPAAGELASFELTLHCEKHDEKWYISYERTRESVKRD